MSKRKRSRPLRRLRTWLTVRAILILDAVVPMLPLEFWQRVGAVVGSLASILPGERRRRTQEHLRLAWPASEYSAAHRRALLRGAFRSAATILFESLWSRAWSERDNWRVRVDGQDRIDRALEMARARGGGIVVYSAHLGAWEVVSAVAPRLLPVPWMVIASKPKEPELEEFILSRRQQGGSKVTYRGDAGLAAMRHLKAGGAVITLADHNLRGPGVAVPFFGQEAHTLLAPARLALQSGAVIMTLFVLREGWGRFVLKVGEPVVPPPFSKNKEERFRQEAQLVKEYTEWIEQAIRADPGQYLWMHRRWYGRSDTLPFPSC